MTENERVKELRKARGLTLEGFGMRVGVQKTAISKIERGENKVTDQMRLAIVREFGVSEVWLRTGEGSMEPRLTREEEIARAVERMMTGESADFKRRLIAALSELTEPQWRLIIQKARELTAAEPTPAERDAAKVADYAEQLRVQRESGGQSSASPTPNSNEREA